MLDGLGLTISAHSLLGLGLGQIATIEGLAVVSSWMNISNKTIRVQILTESRTGLGF